MNIHWYFEVDAFDDSVPQTMFNLAKAAGVTPHWIKYIPFDGGIVLAKDERGLRTAPLPQLPDNDPIIVYGSLNLAQHVHTHTKWRPGVWYEPDRLKCQTYYAYYGPYLLQDSYTFIPYAELGRCHDLLFRTFAVDNAIFIRPDENNKIFAGQIVHRDHFDEFLKRSKFYDPKPTTLTVVSSPVQISAEWRMVVSDGKVISGCQYAENRDRCLKPDLDPAAVKFAENAIQSSAFQPHPIFVIDIAQTPAGLRVIEVGSVNAAGLYACPLEPIVNAMIDQAARQRQAL
jgi:hypothetical protein